MKNKIKVMTEHQDISDEELDRFKNFDSLLIKHQQTLTPGKPISWKIITPVLFAIIAVTSYLWIKNNTDLEPKNQLNVSDSIALLNTETLISTTPTDSSAEHRAEERVKSTHQETINGSEHPKAYEPESERVKEFVPPVTTRRETLQKTESLYIQAEPADGYETLYAYFNKELIYPEAAVKDSVEGVLTVKFVINTEGKAEQIQISGSLGILFDKEAIRLIEHMPVWKPARLNGKPITSKLSLPLTFQLRNRK